MNKTLKVVLVIFCALFLVSGALKLVGSIFNVALGLVTLLVNNLWKVVSHPAVLVAIIIVLAWKLNKKT